MPEQAWRNKRKRQYEQVQLYNEAKNTGIDGRSKMSKAELERAVGR